jgi:hypothetical protein
MSPATLHSYTWKDLAQMAKKKGVPGWHAMRKDQLVRAIVSAVERVAATRGSTSRSPKSNTGAASAPSAPSSRQQRAVAKRKHARPEVRKQIVQLQAKLQQIKNLAARTGNGTEHADEKDRIVLMVRGPYWLHAYWELSTRNVERACAALGQYWHAARPVLRLSRQDGDGPSTIVRNVAIHGGVNNWYIDVYDPPGRFRVEIGYLASNEKFQRLARSDWVMTPSAGVSEAMDANWVDLARNADRIFAMSGGYSPDGGSPELQELLEERLGRPMGSPMHTRFGAGAGLGLIQEDEFHLSVDAEMIVYGCTRGDAHVTLLGEPVQLRPDGTFTVRLHMPDRRQVIPVVASSSDGVEQRTISIAVEKNTKVMEPVFRDSGG